ncbi:MAG: bifunctional DNA-formamidopyrimidine glycosylase/DNA-(apurinic or apyrimidinic site) lyase [Bifidobacteriaceae bacterium]|jgi:formamidopyrimidine-DNA glycosylase|nr:bifunctional DNA-formamidopyrimidine glycosylase/DNA-(apurinic or apyrimidinic site) lyase [Bifidobacteriaceae bacterium]
MPELPEVETVRRGLARLLVGRRVAGVEVREGKSFVVAPGASVERDLEGAAVTAVRRRGKVLLIELDTGYTLVGHLKMTGQMVVRTADERWGAGHPNDSLIGELPDRSTRVILEFDDGTAVYFNDQRKFGWLQLMPASAVAEIPLLAAMGPEPLDPAVDAWPEFRRRIARHGRTSVKAALLNQEVVAGIGNIYADEALWAVKLHPATPVDAIGARKLHQLLDAARHVISLSLSLGGSTDRNYVDAEGRRGSYLQFANVFRRDGQPCPRCGTVLTKLRVAGRGTHICPRCQKLPRA